MQRSSPGNVDARCWFTMRRIGQGVRRIAYELGGGRAVDNTRTEIEASRIAMARVEALARRVPPTAGESSPEVRLTA